MKLFSYMRERGLGEVYASKSARRGSIHYKGSSSRPSEINLLLKVKVWNVVILTKFEDIALRSHDNLSLHHAGGQCAIQARRLTSSY